MNNIKLAKGLVRIARELVLSYPRHPEIKSRQDQIMNDLRNIFKAPVENVVVNGNNVRISVAGKAYGDGYDFNETYRNGKFVNGHCSDKWRVPPFFEKEAKYIYKKYKAFEIVIGGSFI